MALTLRRSLPRALLGAALIGCVSLGFAPDLRADARISAPLVKTIDAILTVNADRTAELVETRRVAVLKPGAVTAAGQQVATYIEGMEELDLIEAYTQKADGRRIDVPADRVFRRDAAVDSKGTYLVDQKALTAFYPDLFAGDTVVFKTRLKIRAGSFSGHLMTYFLHSSAIKTGVPSLKITRADDVREIPAPGSTYRIVVPRDMAIKVGFGGEGIVTETIEDAATITYTATFGVVPPPAEGDSRAPVERAPHILVSTLRDYEDLGNNYWIAAAPHVQPTPAIRKLADEITAGIEDRRAQAKAISDWVKRNIRYLIVHRGIGRDLSIEPAEAILRNRAGECKEHAVLTMALLAAKGIESELVLIYFGNVSLMPQTPTLGFFNHLIVYLPEFDLYDDPTAATSAFGELLEGAAEKPVVHVSARGARVARTPVE